MRYGIEVVTLGPYADPRRVVELAVAAEGAGFEAIAVWDHLAFTWGVPSADPLVTLSAVAQATERLLLVPAVTPIPRHRPQMLAWQLACLDVLSGGRVVLGAGLGGVEQEFSVFGEDPSPAHRAAQADEALDVIGRLWSGERVHHAGRFFRVDGVTLAPLPVQQPRPPIWIGGESGGAARRAARWDGWIAFGGVDEQGQMTRQPDWLSGHRERLAAAGAQIGDGFEVVVNGISHGPGATTTTTAWAEAGATYWMEALSPSFGNEREMLDRARAGPPG